MINLINEKQIIVGINDSHDASACVVIDGKLICAVSEERLQRIKNMGTFPKNAIKDCLKIAGIQKSDIDYVAVGNQNVSCLNLHNIVPSISIKDRYKIEEEYWIPTIYEGKNLKLRNILPDYKSRGILYYPVDEIPFAPNRELDEKTKRKIAEIRKKFIYDYFELPEEKVVFFDHHACHAFYGYYANPLRDKKDGFLVLTADAGGDGAYESINIFKDEKWKCLHKGHDNIIAHLYSYVTLLLGMKPHEHEYKVMGLSAYAKEHEKKKPRDFFRNCLKVEGLKFVRNPELKDFFKYLRDNLKTYRFDGIAGGIQDFAEELMTQWASNAIQESGVNDLGIAGGLGLNIKVNKKLAELPQVNSFFVPPGAGDESLSIGACYALLYRLNNENLSHEISPLRHTYLGGGATEEEVQGLLNHPTIQRDYEIIRNATAEDVADVLCGGEICAVFQGKMEFGPRALGHRSIIADPSKPEIVMKINEAIKKRDFWMPFTPSVLTERINDYVVNPKDINCSYMTAGFDTTDLGKKHLAGAIHAYDKTVRPQRVEKEVSSFYYKIIKSFERKTGVGAVLNTSLNIHGKPIIMKPIQIAEELLVSDGVELNNIYVEGILLRKRRTKMYNLINNN